MATSKNKKTSPKSKKSSSAKGASSFVSAHSKRRTSARPATPKEKLTALRPSGQKDESFFELVHEIARQIPRGRVTSYGAIAACLGTRMSARMVGWAMNTVSHAKKPVPAHRVVNSLGLLTGKHHFSPPGKMQASLEREGVKVKNDKVVEFAKVFWDPSKEL